MSEIWPLDVKNRVSSSVSEAIRPFKCLLLMPFEARFDQIAKVIEEIVSNYVQDFTVKFGMELPIIKRIDWVTSTGVIQQEIWQEICEADLIFCDITGYNPNVMFESGVCSAWKEMKQVVFIKDRFFKQQSAFDIAPIRYTEYEMTSDGIKELRNKIAKLTMDVLIAFPDREGSSPNIKLPLDIDFTDNRDDLRIYTPPFAHRRVVNGYLEFGSREFFPHSWASVGKEKFLNFTLELVCRSVNPKPNASYIGVGLRSMHFYANFAHILYLNHDGRIIITQPDEEPPNFYKDLELRRSMSVNLEEDHSFQVTFNETKLSIQVDDFNRTFQVAQMKKVFGPGLIRLQSYGCWMGVKKIKVTKS